MISDPVREIALTFLKAYAVGNQFFTGGDVLEAFRKTGLPGSEIDWRNKWGAIINEGARRAWYVKAGRVAPSSKQSHTSTLVQWQSRLFKGEASLVGKTAHAHILELRKKVALRELTLVQALWKAYDLGTEEKA